MTFLALGFSTGFVGVVFTDGEAVVVVFGFVSTVFGFSVVVFGVSCFLTSGCTTSFFGATGAGVSTVGCELLGTGAR